MLWLATSILAATLVEPRDGGALRAAPVPAPFATGAVDALACDDGMVGGTLVQATGAAYGNRFESACDAALVRSVSFVQFGAGHAGPYAYRLHLLDADCSPKGTTEILAAPDAAGAPVLVEVDLASLGWCAGPGFVLGVEPLDCVAADDCLPAVAVDASADTDGASHCATVVTMAGAEPKCLAAQSADGRYFDFCLRVEVDCDDPKCTTSVAPASFGAVKRLYADPSPATGR